MKPILFNTEMVQAILDGRKTQTRRVCKISTVDWCVEHDKCNFVEYPAKNNLGVCANFYNGLAYTGAAKPAYQPGDVLYVRETWNVLCGNYIYKANQKPGMKNLGKWCPSIHMPKEAARIFLKVTNVRIERIQDISGEDCVAEGCDADMLHAVGAEFVRGVFSGIWDSTIKKSELPRYGWDANPWVWVYEFEQEIF